MTLSPCHSFASAHLTANLEVFELSKVDGVDPNLATIFDRIWPVDPPSFLQFTSRFSQ